MYVYVTSRHAKSYFIIFVDWLICGVIKCKHLTFNDGVNITGIKKKCLKNSSFDVFSINFCSAGGFAPLELGRHFKTLKRVKSSEKLNGTGPRQTQDRLFFVGLAYVECVNGFMQILHKLFFSVESSSNLCLT